MLKNFLASSLLCLLTAIMAFAGSVCPAGVAPNAFPHSPDNANTGCNVLITINANGSVSVVTEDATPYENSDDIMVGVVNNGSGTVTSLSLSGTDIFGFESDGICIYTFVGSSYCTPSQKSGTDPGDYQGPTSTFVVTNSNSGSVQFSPGIAPGGSTYFSLEGTPSSLNTTVTATTTAAVPALSTSGLVLAGLLLFACGLRALKHA